MGASTPEAEDNCAVMAVKQIMDFLENGNIVNSVNFPKVTMPRSTDIRITVIHENIPNMLSQISNQLAKDGIRTHCIVACASALMMIISKYGFFDMNFSGDFKFDPSRMAQGIVTGVGMIYFQRGTLIDLTTASGIWAVSGIGMAIGAGMYIIGISATFIILLIQLVFHSKNKIVPTNKIKNLSILKVQEENFQAVVEEKLSLLNIYINDVSIKKYDGVYDYILHIEMPKDTREENILSLFDYECSTDFNN